MLKNVTVIGVDVPRTGEQYPKYVLHYKRDDGKAGKIGNLAVKLPEQARDKLKAVAAEVLGGAQPTVGIEIVKEGNYWNLVNVSDRVTETNNNNNNKKQSSGYDSLGNQIGNCVTNSVNSLGAGKTIAEYKTRAIEFLLMGNEIRELAETGQAQTVLATATVEYTTTDEEVTNELGW